MKAQEVITNIKGIYEKYPVTKHLGQHMMQVAAVGRVICDNWKGQAINIDDLTAFLLLHDIGNIVKFDLSKAAMLAPDENLEHWKQRQQEMIAKYGTLTDPVTLTFAREIGVSERILHLLANNSFEELENIKNGNDWEQKIGKYADLRVAPHGVVSLSERMADFEKRYAGKLPPNMKILTEAVYEVEKQIFANCTIKPEEITQEAIQPIIKTFQ